MKSTLKSISFSKIQLQKQNFMQIKLCKYVVKNVQFSGKDKLTSRNTVIFLKVHISCFVIGIP